MFDVDLFTFFRYVLSLIVTIYASIVIFQSAYSWYIWLAGTDRYTAVLRRYVIVQGLKLRFRAFFGDVMLCLLLSIAFCLMWRAQYLLDRINETVAAR